MCDCRVGGGGGGGGLCRPRVISRDQASLMSPGSSGGSQASHTSLPTPGFLACLLLGCTLPPAGKPQHQLHTQTFIDILHTKKTNHLFSVPAVSCSSCVFILFICCSSRGKVPQKDMELTFPGMSGDFTSENFSATLYLIENHAGTR